MYFSSSKMRNISLITKIFAMQRNASYCYFFFCYLTQTTKQWNKENNENNENKVFSFSFIYQGSFFQSKRSSLRGRGSLIFEIWTNRGVMKKLLRNRGLVEKGAWYSLRGGSKLFHQFSLRKACFHYYWNFCLVNIHTCCNQ